MDVFSFEYDTQYALRLSEDLYETKTEEDEESDGEEELGTALDQLRET